MGSAQRQARQGLRQRPVLRPRAPPARAATRPAAGAYQHGPYRHFDILDPKPRTISATTLRDRVVHHAIVPVLEPRFERRFIHHSYTCRTDKGHHRALRQFVKWARGHRYTMVLDVRRFFPSIDHEVMKVVTFCVVRDPEVRALLGHIIDASDLPSMPAHFPGDDLLTPLERRTGLPIGNRTSQFLANVLLDQVDHHVKDHREGLPALRR